jgi:hypothetical protein
MFTLVTHASKDGTTLPPTYKNINSIAELMYTIYARLPDYGPVPTQWRMRNSMGHHIGGGELGIFTHLFSEIVRTQHIHGPIMVTFDNNLTFEIFDTEDFV